MFVNVLPVAIVGALLGATGRPIDMATVFIMGISLGIAVDDTSFFVHEYLARAPRAATARWPSALRHTGPTMVATCVVIVIGFSVLLSRRSRRCAPSAGMTALGLVLAMLCDVFVLSVSSACVFADKTKGPQSCGRYCCAGAGVCARSCGSAQAPETGRDIAQKSQVAQFTFKTLKVSGEMTLVARQRIDRPADVLGRAHRARAGRRATTRRASPSTRRPR